jgi:hypothetical protein
VPFGQKNEFLPDKTQAELTEVLLLFVPMQKNKTTLLSEMEVDELPTLLIMKYRVKSVSFKK